MACQKLYFWVSISGLATYNIIHWIFCLKYWILAFKVQQLKTNQDPDKYNRRFSLLFWAGVFLNIVCAIIKDLSGSSRFSLEERRKLTIAALVFTTPLYISFFVLFDAFRRFRSLKSAEQVINNVKVCALSLAFFTFAFGITAYLLLTLNFDVKEEND